MCGIVLHATMSFSRDWESAGMPIVDVSPSDTLQGVFHVLHSFRMLLFFLMPLLVAPIIWAVFIREGGFRGDGSAMAAMGGGALVRRHAVTLLMPLPIAITLALSASWAPWTGIPSPITWCAARLLACGSTGAATRGVSCPRSATLECLAGSTIPAGAGIVSSASGR